MGPIGSDTSMVGQTNSSIVGVIWPLVFWQDTIGLHYIYAVIIVLVTLMIFVTNILNISVISRLSKMQKTSRYFFIQLSAVDLMTGLFLGVFAIPAAILNRWPLGEVICSFTGYCGTLGIALSITSLTLVTIDRCLFIVKPLIYTTVVTERRAGVTILAIWLINIVIYAVPFAVNTWSVELKYHYLENAYICTFGFENNFPFFLTACVIFTPQLMIIAVCNFLMYKTARKQQQAFEQTVGQLQPPPPEALRAAETNKAFKTTATILVAFFTAYLPKVCFGVSVAVIRAYQIPIDVPTYMSGVVWWIAISNIFMNFFIYSFRNEDFRIATKKFLVENAVYRFFAHRFNRVTAL